MKTKKAQYIIYLIIAVLAFSSFEMISKPTSEFISPIQLTFYRFLIGGIILMPFAVREIRKKKIKIQKKDIAIFALLGFLLVCASMTLSQYGISLSSASISAVIFSSNPLFVSLLAIPILKEKLSALQITGLIIGVAGLSVTCLHMFNGGEKISPSYIAGVILIFAAMVIFAFYTVMNKRLSAKNGSIVTLSFSSVFGAAILVPIMFAVSEDKTVAGVFSFDLGAVWLRLAYLSLIGTGIAYYCYFTALEHLDTALGSMSFLIKPGLASVLCAVFLGEPIGANVIIGIALIMCGLLISILPKGKFSKKKALSKSESLSDGAENNTV